MYPLFQTTSGISRIDEYSIRCSTEYLNSRILDSHSPNDRSLPGRNPIGSKGETNFFITKLNLFRERHRTRILKLTLT